MGTDAGTPFNFHGKNAQELERMVSHGMSPMEAILASTSAAARLIGIQDQVGTIERGKLADLLLFEGNPLRRIDLLRDRSRIIGVMQVGKFVSGPSFEDVKRYIYSSVLHRTDKPALFTRIRDETAETPCETGARRREGRRHT